MKRRDFLGNISLLPILLIKLESGKTSYRFDELFELNPTNSNMFFLKETKEGAEFSKMITEKIQQFENSKQRWYYLTDYDNSLIIKPVYSEKEIKNIAAVWNKHLSNYAGINEKSLFFMMNKEKETLQMNYGGVFKHDLKPNTL